MKLSEVLSLYEEFIEELKEDIEDDILSHDSIIQACVKNDIVVDWYYDHQTTLSDFNPKNGFETGMSFPEAKNQYQNYKADLPFLKQVTVKDLLQYLQGFINYYSPKE